jgi:hypothetical protein
MESENNPDPHEIAMASLLLGKKATIEEYKTTPVEIKRALPVLMKRGEFGVNLRRVIRNLISVKGGIKAA